jgi:hypothetical protein
LLRKEIGDYDFEGEVDANYGERIWRPAASNIDDGRYQGEYLKDTNVKQGRGIYMCKDGTIYEGYWRNNKYHGKGRMMHYNLEIN